MNFKDRLNKYYFKRINEDSTLEKNPIFAVIVCSFASLSSQILAIPFSIIAAPFLLLFKKYEIQIMIFFLFLNNILSISTVLYFEEYLVIELLSLIPYLDFSSFAFSDINLSLFISNTIFACILFPKTIYQNVNENLSKSYGLEWRNLKSKKVPALFYYNKSGQLERVGNLEDGNEQGLWIYYHSSGELKSKKYFVDGLIIKEQCWDVKGNEIFCNE